ncbi:hypothetical protein N7G274_000639 [Stereocaulon virgatum]|uniref:Uncharacterized protein n=1 Tax=Stereocaulon virgatum TaxID=373712 RepID=A0ABR4ARY2_9LECA
MALATQATINDHTFSRYECQIACAIQLYIRNANGEVPSDDTLGYIINHLRGQVGGKPLPCTAIAPTGKQKHRKYMITGCVKQDNSSKAKVYARLKDAGQLDPFLNPDGTLKTTD